MHNAIEAFEQDFARWGLHLPPDDAAARRSGQLREAGWTVFYDFGQDAHGEFLDYYAALRETTDATVTDDWHVRLYESGDRVTLPTVLEAYMYSREPTREELDRVRRKYAERMNGESHTPPASPPVATSPVPARSSAAPAPYRAAPQAGPAAAASAPRNDPSAMLDIGLSPGLDLHLDDAVDDGGDNAPVAWLLTPLSVPVVGAPAADNPQPSSPTTPLPANPPAPTRHAVAPDNAPSVDAAPSELTFDVPADMSAELGALLIDGADRDGDANKALEDEAGLDATIEDGLRPIGSALGVVGDEYDEESRDEPELIAPEIDAPSNAEAPPAVLTVPRIVQEATSDGLVIYYPRTESQPPANAAPVQAATVANVPPLPPAQSTPAPGAVAPKPPAYAPPSTPTIAAKPPSPPPAAVVAKPLPPKPPAASDPSTVTPAARGINNRAAGQPDRVEKAPTPPSPPAQTGASPRPTGPRSVGPARPPDRRDESPAHAAPSPAPSAGPRIDSTDSPDFTADEVASEDEGRATTEKPTLDGYFTTVEDTTWLEQPVGAAARPSGSIRPRTSSGSFDVPGIPREGITQADADLLRPWWGRHENRVVMAIVGAAAILCFAVALAILAHRPSRGTVNGGQGHQAAAVADSTAAFDSASPSPSAAPSASDTSGAASERTKDTLSAAQPTSQASRRGVEPGPSANDEGVAHPVGPQSVPPIQASNRRAPAP